MGRRAVFRYTYLDRELSPTERAVLRFFHEVADPGGVASAPLTRLSREADVSHEAVRVALRHLEGRGKLRLLSRGSPVQPARYQLLEWERATA
jgi:hypothetical protein